MKKKIKEKEKNSYDDFVNEMEGAVEPEELEDTEEDPLEEFKNEINDKVEKVIKGTQTCLKYLKNLWDDLKDHEERITKLEEDFHLLYTEKK